MREVADLKETEAELKALFNRSARYDDDDSMVFYVEDLLYIDEEHQVDVKKALLERGVEVVEIFDYNDNVKRAMEESYRSISIYVVIRYKGRYFKMDCEFGSYGHSDFTDFYEVEPTIKVITEYVKITN